MQNTKDFACVVVMYNQECADSSTCRCLQQVKNQKLQVVVFDNSTQQTGNRKFCQEQGWTFLGGTGNQGISKAYNACIAHLLDQNYNGPICLFDDDTHVDESYFSALSQTISQGRASIFVPFIWAKGRLISPSVCTKRHQNQLFASEEAARSYSGADFSAINSCMAVMSSLFRDYQYDEGIFLDGVDHSFLKDMKQRGVQIGLIDYRCNHEFSGTEKPPKEAAIVRFRIYAKDYRYILRRSKSAYLALVGRRALRLTMRYRDLVFLKEMLNISKHRLRK